MRPLSSSRWQAMRDVLGAPATRSRPSARRSRRRAGASNSRNTLRALRVSTGPRSGWLLPHVFRDHSNHTENLLVRSSRSLSRNPLSRRARAPAIVSLDFEVERANVDSAASLLQRVEGASSEPSATMRRDDEELVHERIPAEILEAPAEVSTAYPTATPPSPRRTNARPLAGVFRGEG